MNNKPLDLTIVTAVLNEAENLPGFLKHATQIAKEVVVVVDYRNEDNSIDIAKQFDCKIVEDRGESEGIVFNNKNRGIKEAKYDWVMILDADERMSSTLIREVTSVVNGQVSAKAKVYQTGFANYEFGKLFTNCDQPKKKFIRLIKKGSFLYRTGKTAEGFGIQTGSIVSGPISSLLLKLPLLRSWYLSRNEDIATFQGLLVHNSHPTIHDFVRKIDHYSTREAKILFEAGRRANLFSLIWWPKKEFLYKYFIWRLYREGVHGFVASVLYSFYWFLIAAKLWSLDYYHRHIRSIEKLEEKYDFPQLKTSL